MDITGKTAFTSADQREKRKKNEFFKNFAKHKVATVSLCIIVLEILAVIFLPMIIPMAPYTTDPLAFNSPPSATHLLGTDDTGRDLFARLVYGGRISLSIGILSTLISIVIGLPLGLLAGYYRGFWETLVMRAADIFMSFPGMILILVVVAIFGSSISSITIVIGVLGWPATAKLLYGNVLSVRKKEYVEAAKALGTSDLAVIFQYVLPNAISPLWMSIAFRISSAMITESGLSFLGAGVQPPQASWGNIIQAANNIMVLTKRLWVWVPASICLMVTIICINFIGEGVRDALDPKMKRL